MEGASQVMFGIRPSGHNTVLLSSEHPVAPQLGIEINIDFVFIKHRISGITLGQRSLDLCHFVLVGQVFYP